MELLLGILIGIALTNIFWAFYDDGSPDPVEPAADENYRLAHQAAMVDPVRVLQALQELEDREKMIQDATYPDRRKQ